MTYEVFRDKLLKIALEKGCDAAEVFAHETDRFSADVIDQTIDSYSVSRSLSIGLRVCKDGCEGYAHTLLMEVPEALVARAVSNAEVLEVGCVNPMQMPVEYPPVAVTENPLAEMTSEQRIELAKKLERCVLSKDARCVRVSSNQVEVVQKTTHIANTLGLQTSRCNVYASHGIKPLLEAGGEKREGYAVRYGTDILDLDSWAENAVEDAARKFGASPVPSGLYPVVLEKHAASELLNGFRTVFSGESAQKGLSRLKEREGEAVAASCVSIADDPLMSFNPRPFDDEGVPSVRTEIVEHGMLKTLLHSLKTAGKAGCASTSNGGRASAISPVEVMPSNLYILPGEQSFEQLLNDMGEGLVIRNFSGLHVGMDPISGDFSLLAGGWLRLQNGELRPVEQITVAGNFFQLLMEIQAVGNDLWLGVPREVVVGAPSLYVKRLMVSGS